MQPEFGHNMVANRVLWSSGPSDTNLPLCNLWPELYHLCRPNEPSIPNQHLQRSKPRFSIRILTPILPVHSHSHFHSRYSFHAHSREHRFRSNWFRGDVKLPESTHWWRRPKSMHLGSGATQGSWRRPESMGTGGGRDSTANEAPGLRCFRLVRALLLVEICWKGTSLGVMGTEFP